MPPLLKVLNLGAGVQSTAVYLMMVKGDLPPADIAIFADTGWEPKAVTEHLGRLMEIGNKQIPVTVVKYHNILTDTLEGWTKGNNESLGHSYGVLPFRIKNKDGSEGKLNRSCTSRYKIEPIEREIRRILGIKSFAQVPPGSVHQSFGISSDEIQRMKISERKAIKFYYPLILNGASDDTPLNWRRPGIRREDCIKWTQENYGITPPRSACIGCPFHNNTEWRRMRDESPEDFQAAIVFDEAIRNAAGLDGEAYIHKSLKPLRNADLGDNSNQIGLLEECDGICGV
jgi:hypothetical protein